MSGHLVLRRVHQLAPRLIFGFCQRLSVHLTCHVLFVEQWRLAGRTPEAALVPVAIQREQSRVLRRLRTVILDLHAASAGPRG